MKDVIAAAAKAMQVTVFFLINDIMLRKNKLLFAGFITLTSLLL